MGRVTDDEGTCNGKQSMRGWWIQSHSPQHCSSGDNTLQALQRALVRIKQSGEAGVCVCVCWHPPWYDSSDSHLLDEYFVVLISDANLEQYGIEPGALAHTLTQDRSVHASIIFIGGLERQAERYGSDRAVPWSVGWKNDDTRRISNTLPPGHHYRCQEAKDLPQIMSMIFLSTVES